MYVNLNGTHSLAGYFNYGFPLRMPKSNLNFNSNVNYSQSQTLLAQDSMSAVHNDYAHIYSKNTSMSEKISWTTNIKKNFDMNFSSVSQYNINQRSGAPAKTENTTGNLNSFSHGCRRS